MSENNYLYKERQMIKVWFIHKFHSLALIVRQKKSAGYAMQRLWVNILGAILVVVGLAGFSRREGTMSEILIALAALYMVLSR